MGHLESKWGSRVKDYVVFEQGSLKWDWKHLDEEDIPLSEKNFWKNMLSSRKILF